jgi:GNAT superfamily N-acetyltransferase
LDVEVVPLTDEHRVAAGALLASRHARERRRYPLLPPGPEDPAVSADLVAGVLAFCNGVAAFDDRRELVGFLTTFEQIPAPSSPAARYSPERSFVHLVHGHAVADSVDAFVVYAAMFAVLAEGAVDLGVVDFVVHVPIGDPAPEAAWAALGFGRVNAVAVRDLAPLTRPSPPEAEDREVEVRVATAADLDVVDRLVDEEAVFHAGSPIFRPYVREQTAQAVRDQLAADLSSDDHAFLLARSGDHDVGVLSVGPGLGSPLYVPDGAAYIAATAVLPGARRSGVGFALTDAAFAWARQHGYRAACLHFATANLTSTAFWAGVGFTPVMAHLRRRLDDRVLARGSRP